MWNPTRWLAPMGEWFSIASPPVQLEPAGFFVLAPSAHGEDGSPRLCKGGEYPVTV